LSLTPQVTGSNLTSPFDAVIAIGVLIKGDTMHFEYIADSVSKGLMRVGLDTGVPVIFGLLTVLNESQAMARAGMIAGDSHNHANDWASAAVELGSKGKQWAQGKLA
jgi:6,7-dimethyl-8-ribityllumazine synthase